MVLKFPLLKSKVRGNHKAKRTGVSIYDICLRYMPEYGEPKVDFGGDSVNMTRNISDG